MMAKSPKIRTRERDTIIQALAAGVVPRIGLQHIQVGRAAELNALMRDIDRIADDGSSVRFIIGEYGAGKTFFSNLVRLIALEKKLVTAHADLAPDRRLHATGGQARTLYAEAVKNLSTRTNPDGGALQNILERFVTECVRQGEALQKPIETVIDERLAALQDLVGGYDFATVVKAYWRGSETGDDVLKTGALRWLRGEFSTKTEARQAVGVRSIIDDASIYDGLKLLSEFVRLAGYAGLLIVFDEMVNLYKLQSAQARKQNYEQILRMLNDVLQGNVGGIGFLFGGTPEFLMDPRRGLYSYEALQSRLSENTFAVDGLVDMTGPIMRLQSLTPEELFVLLRNLRHVYSCGNEEAYLVPDEALEAFMAHCNERVGEAYFRTPRNAIKAFVHMLAVLEQNPQTEWRVLLGATEIVPDEEDEGADDAAPDGDDELTSITL
jgi:hypothetical protein